MRAVLGVVLVVLLALAGCTTTEPAPDPSPASEPAPNSFEDTISLPPRGAHEINFHMAQHAEIAIAFTTSASVAWDLHSHPEGRVVEWEKGEGRGANLTFSAPSEGTYSIYVRSSAGSTTILRISMRGAFAIES